MKTLFYNYKGELTVAPKKFKTIIVNINEGSITVSMQSKNKYRTTYGLQSRDFDNLEQAMIDCSDNIKHLLACGETIK